MPSTSEQQKPDPPQRTSHEEAASDSMHAEPPFPSQIEEEYRALATQTAKLGLKDQNTDPDSKDADDTWSDEEAPAETVDENTETQPAHSTATAPVDGVQADQSTSTEDLKAADDTTASKDTDPSPSQDEDHDETSTPRFQTYMMTSKTALTSNPTELTNYYNHASRLARVLLSSHDKHGDLPLVIHAQACLVLGCSDEDDCYERMEDAVVLLNHAMEEGALDREQGGAMIKTCEVVMGVKGQRVVESEDEDDGEGEGAGDGQGGGDGRKESKKSKDEDADDGEGYEKNDALP